jgi:SSS family solute:Na+ symporter
MATQCSTNSILGAPAFVAFVAGGGLVWLQYELALPLAMIFIAVFLMPIFHRQRLVSVYLYLGRRFDAQTQLLISGLFQLSRAAVAGITVYGVASMIAIATGLSFAQSVLLFGLITIAYDVLGGIRAVIISDVIQMVILTGVLIYLAMLLISGAGGLEAMLEQLSLDRRAALSFQHHGLGDGHDFAFLPMLIGGFFLYVAYYGCDQSQVQRQLCASSQDDTQKVLIINGLLRFPLVLLYCLIGAGLAAYAGTHPEFIASLPLMNGSPNYNMALPALFGRELPIGVIGLAVVALLAAAMSSLDSVINSLSATTLKDFVKPWLGERIGTPAQELVWGRVLTVCWGVFALITAFFVDDIASTVIVAVNKVGSLINGPILGVFLLGLLTRSATGQGCQNRLCRRSYYQCNPLGGCAVCLVVVVECDWAGCDYGDRSNRQSRDVSRGRNARSHLECANVSQRRFLTKLDTGLWRFVVVDNRVVCRLDAVWGSLVNRVSRSTA